MSPATIRGNRSRPEFHLPSQRASPNTERRVLPHRAVKSAQSSRQLKNTQAISAIPTAIVSVEVDPPRHLVQNVQLTGPEDVEAFLTKHQLGHLAVFFKEQGFVTGQHLEKMRLCSADMQKSLLHEFGVLYGGRFKLIDRFTLMLALGN